MVQLVYSQVPGGTVDSILAAQLNFANLRWKVKLLRYEYRYRHIESGAALPRPLFSTQCPY